MARRTMRSGSLLTRIPLRLAVAVAVTLLVGCVVALLSLSSYRGNQQAIATATDETIAQMATLLDEHLGRVFAPADNQLRLLAYSRFGSADTLEAQLALLPLAREVLTGNPMVQAAFAGDDQGRFVLFRPLLSESVAAEFAAPEHADMLVQVIERTTAGAVQGSYHFFNADDTRLEARPLDDYTFDPRERLWFEAARRSETTILTEPYRFFTTQVPGITMARRSVDGGGVVGLDIAFAQLTAHLDRLRLTPSTEVAIVDAEGRVVAHHAAMRMLTPAGEERFRLAGIEELPSPALHQAFTLAPERDAPLVMRQGDDGWYQVKIPLAPVGALELMALLAVPEREIFVDARRRLVRQLMLALPIFVLAVLAGLWLLRRPVAALHHIAAQTHALEAFDMTPRPMVSSRIREIDQLGGATARLSRTLSSFLETSRALSRERDVESVLDKILHTVIQATLAAGGALYQLDTHQQLARSCQQGRRPGVPTSTAAPLASGDDTDRPLVAQAASRRCTVTHSRDGALHVATPLHSRDGKLLGAMLVWLPLAPQAIGDADDTRVGFIEALSASAAVALENSQLLAKQRKQLAQITYQANHDLLTGLPNRSAFTERLDEAARDCQQRRRRLAVLYLDLDGFKPINDGLGHAVGNQVLIAVSRRLQALVDGNNMVARLVGDEFSILLVDAPPQSQIIALAENLLENLACVYEVSDHSKACRFPLALYVA